MVVNNKSGIHLLLPRAVNADGRAQPFEIRDAVLAAHNSFAVERHRLNPERRQRLGDRRHAIGVVVAAPGEHAHARRRRTGR